MVNLGIAQLGGKKWHIVNQAENRTLCGLLYAGYALSIASWDAYGADRQCSRCIAAKWPE